MMLPSPTPTSTPRQTRARRSPTSASIPKNCPTSNMRTRNGMRRQRKKASRTPDRVVSALIPEDRDVAQAIDFFQDHPPQVVVGKRGHPDQPWCPLLANEERRHRQAHLVDQARTQELCVDRGAALDQESAHATVKQVRDEPLQGNRPLTRRDHRAVTQRGAQLGLALAQAVDDLLGSADTEKARRNVQVSLAGERHLDRVWRQAARRTVLPALLRAQDQARIVGAERSRADKEGIARRAEGVDGIEVFRAGEDQTRA